MVSMNRLSTKQRARILACLVEGNSIRSTCRLTGASKNTVAKLLVDLGRACSEYQDAVLRDLPCERIQCDEAWAFVYSKAKNVPSKHAGEFGYGDVWTFTGICADCKLVSSWLVGERTEVDAAAFMKDLADRLANRVQLTTDGHRIYLESVEAAFGGEFDYAMLIKLYGEDRKEETRYSPAKCLGTEVRRIGGNPDPEHISTSYVERQNLTMRMGMRRFTRLTNAFSKKAENLAHAVSLHFMYYNFVRLHKTLGTTPAAYVGVADHVWTPEEVAGLLDKRPKL
jgi:IS1 family transposase